MVDLQQLNSLNQQYGLPQGATPPPDQGSLSGQAAIDALNTKLPFLAPQSQPSIGSDLGKLAAEGLGVINNAGNTLENSVNEEETNIGNQIKNPNGLTAGLNVVGPIAGAITGITGDIAKPILDKLGISQAAMDALDGFASTDTGKEALEGLSNLTSDYSNFAAQHPQTAEALKNTGDILGAAGLVTGPGELASGISEKLASLFPAAAEEATTGAEGAAAAGGGDDGGGGAGAAAAGGRRPPLPPG